MLHTLASIFTGALIIAAPVFNHPDSNEVDCTPAIEVLNSKTEMSYPVSYRTCSIQLEHIRQAAIDAGLGMVYEKSEDKSKLYIDMVIVNAEEDDFEIEHLVIEKGEAASYLNWKVDEEGKAIAFNRSPVNQEF